MGAQLISEKRTLPVNLSPNDRALRRINPNFLAMPELSGFNFDRARAATEKIFATTAKVLSIAEADGVPPSVAADRLAERRMSDVGRLRGIWLGTMGSA